LKLCYKKWKMKLVGIWY